METGDLHSDSDYSDTLKPQENTLNARLAVALLAICVVATLLAYWPVLNAPWFYDDTEHVITNTSVTGDSILPVFTRNFWGQTPGIFSVWSYRPIASLSTRLVYQVCPSPFCARSVNLLIHIGFCLSLFVFFCRWFGELAAALGAGLFMIHPIHSEAILFAVGRADLLAACFSLAAFTCYLKRRYVWMLLLFTLGLLSKENAALLFPLMLAHAALTRRFQSMRSYIAFSIPFFAIGIIDFILHRLVSGRWWEFIDALQNPLILAPKAERWAHVLSFPAEYLSRILWPFSIPADFSMGAYQVTPWHDPRLLLIGAISIVLPIVVLLLTRKFLPWRNIAIGIWAYYCLALIAFQWHSLGAFTLADRHLYLPFTGLAFSVAATVQAIQGLRPKFLTTSYRRMLASTLSFLPVGFLATALFFAVPAYAGPISLGKAWLKNSPGGARAYFMIGNEYATQGRPDLALPYFEKAIEIYPSFNQAKLSRAKALSDLGKQEESGKLFADLYQNAPDEPDTAFSYAVWLWRGGKLKEAESIFSKTARVWPQNSGLIFEWGRLTEVLSGPAVALPILENACRLDTRPTCTKAAAATRIRLLNQLLQHADFDQAKEELNRVGAVAIPESEKERITQQLHDSK